MIAANDDNEHDDDVAVCVFRVVAVA